MTAKILEKISQAYCYKLVQGFNVTCLFTGQYNTKGYEMVTDMF